MNFWDRERENVNITTEGKKYRYSRCGRNEMKRREGKEEERKNEKEEREKKRLTKRENE